MTSYHTLERVPATSARPHPDIVDLTPNQRREVISTQSWHLGQALADPTCLGANPLPPVTSLLDGSHWDLWDAIQEAHAIADSASFREAVRTALIRYGATPGGADQLIASALASYEGWTKIRGALCHD